MPLFDLLQSRGVRRVQAALALGLSDTKLRALNDEPATMNYVQARKLAEICAISIIGFADHAGLTDEQMIDFLAWEESEFSAALARSPGARLKARRLELQMTQVELSERSTVKQATISNIESSSTFPQAKTLDKLARALDMDVRSLIPDDSIQKYIKQATRQHNFSLLNRLRSNG